MVGDVGYTHKKGGNYHEGEMASLFVPKPSERRPAAGTRYNWGARSTEYGGERREKAEVAVSV